MNKEHLFALKGNIIYASEKSHLSIHPNSYLVCQAGLVAGVFSELPEICGHIQINDYKDQIIIPGLVDLHLHAPQYAFKGIGMDLELLEWLEAYPFKEEALYNALEYAKKAYKLFVDDLVNGGTVRAAIFATIHKPATEFLMKELSNSGLNAFVGKVNMDRNSPPCLQESTKKSLDQTEQWILETINKYPNVKPIITPRFVPSCTSELMQGLGKLALKYHMPVQSHLSENKDEVAWVSKLYPQIKSYSEVYNQFGLFGMSNSTIMAHCVYCTDTELELLAENKVFVAHCPQSNTNLASGIAPIRKMLNMGISMGLGTDVAGGFSTSIFRAMSDAVQVSKLRKVLLEESDSALSIPEVFYLGTKGGGSFWGKVGSFEPGYEFDALVINDDNLGAKEKYTLEQRLERIIYLSDENNIKSKYISGQCIY